MLMRDRLLGANEEEESSLADKIFNGIIIFLAAVMFAAVLTKEVWLKPYLISGTSMENTLQNDDWVLADAFKKVKRGDVVIIYNRKKGIMLVKRVIGVSGDAFKYDKSSGAVYFKTDGDYKKVEEEYALIRGNKAVDLSEEIVVGEGEVFVMGDNRGVSDDSRHWGAMPTSDIVGVVSEWTIENRKNLKWLYPYI